MESHGGSGQDFFPEAPWAPCLSPLAKGHWPGRRPRPRCPLGRLCAHPCQPQATGRVQAGQAQFLGCPQAALGDGPSTLFPVCLSVCCRACPVWPKGLGVQQGLGWRLWLPCRHCPPHSCAARICPHCSRPCSHPPDTPGVPPPPPPPRPLPSISTAPGLAPPLSGSPRLSALHAAGEVLKPVPTGETPHPRRVCSGLPPPGAGLGPSYVSAGSLSKHRPRRGWGCRQGPQGTGLNLWGHQSPPDTAAQSSHPPLVRFTPWHRRRAKSEASPEGSAPVPGPAGSAPGTLRRRALSRFRVVLPAAGLRDLGAIATGAGPHLNNQIFMSRRTV